MNERKIGTVTLDNPFIAAPMAGVTDASMRSICRRMGAALVYSEMVSGKGLLYHNRNTEQLLSMTEEEHPTAVQLFGAEPDVIHQAAHQLDQCENEILDLNVGCPVQKVVRNGEGSALLRHLDRLYDVAAAVVRGTGKPVTAKIRIGWNYEEIVALEAARALEAAGVAAVAVHGRTREQFYTGAADWTQIARIKQNLSIPVIGNGDVFTAADGLRMLDETGCDFVMVGRGMLGNPWIFRELRAAWEGETVPSRPSRREKAALMQEHFRKMTEQKGTARSVLEMRKHVAWYLKGEPGAARLRRQVNGITDAAALEAFFEGFGSGA